MTKINQHLHFPELDSIFPPRDHQPRITLVGAGPGDPDLITRKGLRALQTADVVLYDALIHPELLTEAPAGSIKIYVGKRAGRHSYQQEQINQLLLEAALRCGHAVRLKGGDPFVFGRGQEEKVFAESRGVEVSVIPGISSSTSLLGLQGVPPTHRGLSRSFWVLTARAANGKLPSDLHLAAKSDATAIILMGLGRLQQIQEIYRLAGKGSLPAMIIQNGSQPNEKSWLGSVNDIHEKFLSERDRGPGIIVLGKVVGLHPEFAKQSALASEFDLATSLAKK